MHDIWVTRIRQYNFWFSSLMLLRTDGGRPSDRNIRKLLFQFGMDIGQFILQEICELQIRLWTLYAGYLRATGVSFSQVIKDGKSMIKVQGMYQYDRNLSTIIGLGFVQRNILFSTVGVWEPPRQYQVNSTYAHCASFLANCYTIRRYTRTRGYCRLIFGYNYSVHWT